MPTSTQNNLALWAKYGDLYNEFVRPERKYTISHYLRTRWAPLLGAARLWFIVALRQRCFWNNKQDWCIVDKQFLAKESGVSLRTINRIVAKGRTGADEQGYVSRFFTKTRRRRHSQRAGRTVNAPNRYQVLLDDPLTPDDQARLALYLRRMVTDGSPTTTLNVLQELCACSDTELRAKLAQQTCSLAIPSFDFVLDVVKACCPLPSQKEAIYVEIARAASRLHNAFTRPEHVYMGNQYFRLKWLPFLGPALSLLVVNLRARCYWNERTGELRNTCQGNWSSLAQEIGCTQRQLRNMRRSPYLAKFITLLVEGRGPQPSQFRVEMIDPLTKDDQQRFDLTCRTSPDQIADPETGQLGIHSLLTDAEILAHSKRKFWHIEESNAEILAHSKRKFWHVEGLNAEILARHCGNFGTCTKLLIITPILKGLAKTTVDVSLPETIDKPLSESDGELLAVAILDKLLAALTIQEPNKHKLISRRPMCSHVVAWGLYALTQRGLSKNKAGYVYNRLLAGDPPPADMLTLAALNPAEWRLFYRAARSRQSHLAPEHVLSEPDLKRKFALWSDTFGPVWDDLTFALDTEHALQEGEGRGQEPPLADGDLTPGLVPDEVSSLLSGDEVIERIENRWTVATSDLYQAYRLACAAGEQPFEPVDVYLVDGYEQRHPLDAEILALGEVTPLDARLWSAAVEELRWQMSRAVFERWWSEVKPLGIVHNCETGEGVPCMVLGTPTRRAQEWLSTHQATLVSRTLSGILDKPVGVQFVVCIKESMPLY